MKRLGLLCMMIFLFGGRTASAQTEGLWTDATLLTDPIVYETESSNAKADSTEADNTGADNTEVAESEVETGTDNTAETSDVTGSEKTSLTVSHLVTIRVGQQISLAQCSQKKYSYQLVNGTATLKNGIFSSALSGDFLVEAQSKTLSEYIIIRVIQDSSALGKKLQAVNAQNIEFSNKKLTKKNLVKRYQYYQDSAADLENISDWKSRCQIAADGVNNYWDISNSENVFAEKLLLGSFLRKNTAKVKSVRSISEYDGIYIKLNQEVSEVDAVAAAYAKAAKYERISDLAFTIRLYKKNKLVVKKAVTFPLGTKKVHLAKGCKKGKWKLTVTNQLGTKKTIRYKAKKVYKTNKSGVWAAKRATVYSNLYQKKKLATLKSGRLYQRLKKGSNGWTMVKIDGKTGFVKSSRLKSAGTTIVSSSDTLYSYADLQQDLKEMEQAYANFASLFSIGTTADNRQIYCLRIGNKDAKTTLLIHASIHAREWINTQLLMLETEYTCSRYYDGNAKLFDDVCVYVVPMVNPDGVQISQYGPSGINDSSLRAIVKKIGGPYKTWKANARGVDLNRNYSNGFGYKSKKKPASEEYAGKSAGSENETQAMMALIEEIAPSGVINYHTAGQIIYCAENSSLTQLVHSITGYSVVIENRHAYGNLGDWLSARGITWCTPETFTVPSPVAHSKLASTYNRQKALILSFARLYQ